jgi:hypothetical protein
MIVMDDTFKTCYKCKLSQEKTNFGKLKSSKDGYRYDCNCCRKKYRKNNMQIIKEKQSKYYERNKLVLLAKNKKYRETNISTINNQRQQYRNRPEIKKHIHQKNKEYLPIKKEKIKKLRQTNLNFKISEIIRSKVHKMIKNKTTSYQNIIGCDIFTLKKWIEFRFDNNMNWNNLGLYWQIDHILPINSFDFNNQYEQNICFHWTNLQPLKSDINRQKSDKLELHYYFNNIVNVIRFNSKYKNFLGYQTLRESIKWLRIKTSGMVISPHMKCINSNTLEMDNPQPSS